MPTLEEIIANIDRIADHVQSEMARAASHRELLEQNQQQDDLPLHDAIVEKALRDTDLPGAMAAIERAREALQEQVLSPELSRALDRLEQLCKEAAASMSSSAPNQ